ncbi:peptidase [Salisaeta longa]|uniref:peptidase n=1 Tax=Salisaeta longa TaxID=503170 RepID=UPI0003B31410|nr:peptidase [Salisaeta longa]
MPHILFVFLDGVGLGPHGPNNPLATHRWRGLERLAGDQPWSADLSPVHTDTHVVRPIDATLGVPQLPQSGTGQASLFTGVNCAALVGRHFGPFPHSATHALLAENNVFHRLEAHGASAAFANAYPSVFFARAERRNRWTVTTRCCRGAGVRLRSTEDLLAGRALSADLTRHGWQALDAAVPPVTEQAAAAHLHALGRQHTFTLFEYYLTDKAGHGRLERPLDVLRSLDAFFDRLLDLLDPARDLLLITSDHGNLEALDQKPHTRHPVPLIAYGANAGAFASVADLTGVVPAIEQALSPEEMPRD